MSAFKDPSLNSYEQILHKISLPELRKEGTRLVRVQDSSHDSILSAS